MDIADQRRRAAMKIAADLPIDRETALAILDLARALVNWTDVPGIPTATAEFPSSRREAA